MKRKGESVERADSKDQPTKPASVTPDHLTQVWRNSLTVGGGIVAALAVLFMVAFFTIEFASPQRNPYLGLFTFLVFPCVLVVGVVAMAAGLVIARHRFHKTFGSDVVYQYYPRIDLTNLSHRRYLGFATGGVALAIPMIGVLSYEGYHFTDSNQFCGAVCHTVMQPQYTAYQQSPHAHVGCVECHIGTGASWYVKSKLSGIRQVFAVALDSYPRPIPPAIQELRPATETCRACHWPAKFYGDQLVNIEHFASDESNTHTRTQMILKTGGSDPSTGPPSGIHWHMALGFSIEYVATDKFLQNIPWVRMTDQSTGRQSVYRSDGLPTSDPPPAGIRRTVDCMDCHNRPTHVFRSPDRAVNVALNVNPSFQSLPFAKREVVAALTRHYASRSEGLASIADAIARFYEAEHPKIWQARKADIDRLILAAKDIYSTNFFPEMNVSWRTYPDNIGHKIFPGCFRCHEGNHVDSGGRAISHDCKSCHEFFPSVESAQPATTAKAGEFVHPYPLDPVHGALRCNECHTGGPAPPASCEACHSETVQFRAGTLPLFQSLGVAAEPMAELVQCTDCHDLSAPRTVKAIDERCMDCHSDEEEKYAGMLANWTAELDRLFKSVPTSLDPANQKLIDMLRKAGPAHNVEAARTIIRSVASPTAASTRTDDP